MNSSQLSSLRKFIPAIGILAGVLILGALIYLLVVRPQVIVTAPIGSNIIIAAANGSQAASAGKTSSATTSLGVGTGTYTVTIAHDSAKQLYTVNLNLFDHKQLAFDASPALNSLLVARQSAYNAFSVNNTQVTYLDTTKRLVETIDAAGRQSTLAGATNSFTNGDDLTGNVYAMRPIAHERAIIQTNDKLFVLQDNQLTPLNTTGFPGSIQSFTIGANTNQDSFVIAANTRLYFSSSADATPQKIVDLGKQVDQLAYGGDRAIAYSTRMPDSNPNIKSYYAIYAIDPIVVNIKAKSQHTLLAGPIASASIAPDGNHALIETQATSDTTGVYDLASGAMQYTVANSTALSPIWLDASHYVFAQGSDIWKYDTNARSAVTVGTLPDSLQATSVTYNQTTGNYFVTAYNDADTAAIYKLSTASIDQNAAAAAKIARSAPDSSQLFSFAYINITAPTLRIHTSILNNNPSPEMFAGETRASRQAGLKYLQDHHIDTSKLTITYNPDPLP